MKIPNCLAIFISQSVFRSILVCASLCLFNFGCGQGIANFGTKLDSSGANTDIQTCKPNQLNADVCLVDKVGSFIYETEYGGRTQIGKSFIGTNALAVLSIPMGWYDGQTKITFSESNLNTANKSKIRLGKNLLGFDGTMVTSLPTECLNESDSNCMISATASRIYYAYTDQYGGRTSLCTLNSASKLLSDCWIDSVNTRMNSTTPILDLDCSATGAVGANCTARANSFWYSAEDGGRTNCSAGATSVTACWLNIPSGSVTLSSSAASGGATSDCVDARSPAFSVATSCRTNLVSSPAWYVYNTLYGGRDSECTSNNDGSCFFKNGYDDVDTDLKPENVKMGIKVFDVTGTFEGEGIWASAAHRDAEISQITISTEAVTYRDKPSLPAGYLSIPKIASADEGSNSITDNGVLRSNWNSTCGLTGSIADRILDCASKFDFNATWIGATEGNAGQGAWKLVVRTGNVSVDGIYREVWRDERTGLLWSSVVSKNLNWCQAAGVHTTDASGICNNSSHQTQPAGAIKAVSACYEGASESSTDSRIDVLAKGKTTTNPLSVNWRIPTSYDYEVADYNGIRYVMPDMGVAGNVEWTGTTRASDLAKSWVYDSRNGATDVRARTDSTVVVRCVGDKGFQ